MDRVRFGRALGYGARHAAKSLMKAAEAASAPSPSGSASRAAAPHSQMPRVAERAVQTQRKVATARTHARRLGQSVWTPLATFSSVVWLQVTGTFFTLLALFLSEGLWKHRDAAMLTMGTHAAEKFYLQLVAFAIFTYFAISNFVRAYLRERR